MVKTECKNIIVLITTVLFSLLVCLSIFVFASGVEARDKIEFMVWGGASSDRIEELIIATFEKDHPHIDVELVNSGGNHLDKLITSIVSGNAPDLALVDAYDYPSVVMEGLATDITDWAQRDGIIAKLEEELHPAAFEEMWVDGRLYSVANLRIGMDGMFINHDLFAEGGIAPPTMDETLSGKWSWHDFRQNAVSLTRDLDGDGQMDQWGVDFHEYFIWPFVRMNGGRLLNEDRTRVALDEPAAVEAIQWLADLGIQSQAIAWNFDHGFTFTKGKSAMMVHWIGGVVQTLRDVATWYWDITAFPAGKEGSISTVKGNEVIIPSNAENKKLAWEFMKFLGSEEAYYIYGMEGRFFPLHKTALRRVAEDSEAKGLYPAHLKSILQFNAQPLPLCPGYRRVQNLWVQNLRSVWRGEKPANTVCKQIAEMSIGILREAQDKTHR